MVLFDKLFGAKKDPVPADSTGVEAAAPQPPDWARRLKGYWDMEDEERWPLCEALLNDIAPHLENGKIKKLPDDDEIELRARIGGTPVRINFEVDMGWVRPEMKVTNRIGEIELERDHEKIPQERGADDDWADDDELRVFVAKGIFVEGDESEVDSTLGSLAALPPELSQKLLTEMERLRMSRLYGFAESLSVGFEPNNYEMADPVQHILDGVALMKELADALASGERDMARSPTSSSADTWRSTASGSRRPRVSPRRPPSAGSSAPTARPCSSPPPIPAVPTAALRSRGEDGGQQGRNQRRIRVSEAASMTRALALALALLCATAASADPLVVRTVFEIDDEHGCSRSFATRGVFGLLTLEIRDDSTATVSLETREINIFGPSRGSFQQGDREFTERRSKVRKTWTGLAERTADGWTVRLDRVEVASVDQPQEGGSPFPPATASAAALVLACRQASVSVFPPVQDPFLRWDTAGQKSEPVDVLACEADQELFDLVHLITVDGALILGSGGGIVVSGRHTMGGGKDRQLLRQAAEVE